MFKNSSAVRSYDAHNVWARALKQKPGGLDPEVYHLLAAFIHVQVRIIYILSNRKDAVEGTGSK